MSAGERYGLPVETMMAAPGPKFCPECGAKTNGWGDCTITDHDAERAAARQARIAMLERFLADPVRCHDISEALACQAELDDLKGVA